VFENQDCSGDERVEREGVVGAGGDDDGIQFGVMPFES
jgi:hypothetical protein